MIIRDLFAALALLLMVSGSAAFGGTLESEIERLNDKWKRLVRKGRLSLGNSADLLMNQRFRCQIIEQTLFSHDDNFTAIGIQEFEDPDESNERQVAKSVLMLSEWVHQARQVAKMEHKVRVYSWNVGCVGRHGISLERVISTGEVEAEFVRQGSYLIVRGSIDSGFFERFKEYTINSDEFTTVAFFSGGGSIRDAIATGQYIRDQGWDTQTWGSCHSACPLALFGGVRRMIIDDVLPIGFHQLSVDNGQAIIFEAAYDLIKDYSIGMGVDGDQVIDWMLSAEPEFLHLPEPRELCASGAATFIKRVCAN